MKILLLGGTGAMGAYLSELLAERGEDVYVTSRSDRAKDGIHFIKGNAHDTEFLKETLKAEYDVIVDFMVYTTDEFRQRVTLLLNSAEQYIYFSSSRVYSDSKTPITESSPRLLDVCEDKEYIATDEYALAKARQENLLFSNSSNNWTIVRPYITYSSSRLQLGAMEKEDWLFRAVLGKNIIVPRDVMSKTTTMTYGFDVAQAIAKLILNSKAYGKAVHITGNSNMQWNHVLDIYLDVISKRTGKRPQVTLLDNSNELMIIMNNKYQVQYDRLYNRVFDNTLAVELCGQLCYTPMDVGLKKCLNKFFEGQQEFKQINWKFEGWADSKCHECFSPTDIDGWKNIYRYYRSRFRKLKP